MNAYGYPDGGDSTVKALWSSGRSQKTPSGVIQAFQFGGTHCGTTVPTHCYHLFICGRRRVRRAKNRSLSTKGQDVGRHHMCIRLSQDQALADPEFIDLEDSPAMAPNSDTFSRWVSIVQNEPDQAAERFNALWKRAGGHGDSVDSSQKGGSSPLVDRVRSTSWRLVLYLTP